MNSKSSLTQRRLTRELTRRHFLGGTAALGSLVVLSRHTTPAWAQRSYDKNPFSLGVASGDPLPDGVVLWTRLAPQPLLNDSLGGMPPTDVPVRWRVAEDPNMRTIVQQGTANASAALGHSVHVELTGLEPAHTYWYQFESGEALSPIGRTRTAPAFNSSPERLRFAFASCQNWPAGYFVAYRRMAIEDLHFVLHLGDYIYEGKIGENARNVDLSAHLQTEIYTLEQYRWRYALYKLDPHLQKAHAAFPFIVTWDDHEVDNNYADEIDQDNSPPEALLKRRAVAYQAYYENMPLRLNSLPEGPDLTLYRRLTFGDLAQFSVLDTRQYRSDQLSESSAPKRSAESLSPAQSLMGFAQRDWLLEGLNRSTARWNVIAQQVIMAQFIRSVSNKERFNMDAWDGYPGERQKLMTFLAERQPRNPIVLAGDSHSNLVSDLKADFDNPASAIVGSEFAGTSISSGGVNAEGQQSRLKDIAHQPHLKWFEGTKRGYVSCTLNRTMWLSDFMQVDDVKKSDSAVTIGPSWAVEDGKPGVQRA